MTVYELPTRTPFLFVGCFYFHAYTYNKKTLTDAGTVRGTIGDYALLHSFYCDVRLEPLAKMTNSQSDDYEWFFYDNIDDLNVFKQGDKNTYKAFPDYDPYGGL